MAFSEAASIYWVTAAAIFVAIVITSIIYVAISSHMWGKKKKLEAEIERLSNIPIDQLTHEESIFLTNYLKEKAIEEENKNGSLE